MEFKFTLSKEDILNLNLYHIEKDAALQKRLNNQRMITVALLALIVVVAIFKQDLNILMRFSVLIIFLIAWALGYKKFFYMMTKRRMMKVINDPNNSVLFEERTAKFGEDSLLETIGENSMEIFYKDIYKLQLSEQAIYIYLNEKNSDIIPLKAFNSKSEMDEFCAQLDEKIKYAKEHAVEETEEIIEAVEEVVEDIETVEAIEDELTEEIIEDSIEAETEENSEEN